MIKRSSEVHTLDTPLFLLGTLITEGTSLFDFCIHTLDTLWVGTALRYTYWSSTTISYWPGASLIRNTFVLSRVSAKLVCAKRKYDCVVASRGEGLDLIDLGEGEDERQVGPRGRQKSDIHSLGIIRS